MVGAGMAGAAAAWVLARRGRSVVLVDRFARAHDRGSSHGAERIFRFGYTETAYVELAQASLAGWHDLGAAAGAPLLHLTGVVDHGDEAELAEMVAACTAVGRPRRDADRSGGSARWPGLRFETDVVHQPDAGRVDADRTLVACWDQAAAAGADVRFDVPVAGVRRAGDGVAVRSATRWCAQVPPWSPPRGGPPRCSSLTWPTALVPPITVTAESVAWFRPTTGPWPSFIHRGRPWPTGSARPTGSSRPGCTAPAR